MLLTGLLPSLQLGQTAVRLDALYQSHIKNHDLDNMLLMANTGVYSNWVSHMAITGLSSDSFTWRIGMLNIDMETGVMLGFTISVIIGISNG